LGLTSTLAKNAVSAAKPAEQNTRACEVEKHLTSRRLLVKPPSHFPRWPKTSAELLVSDAVDVAPARQERYLMCQFMSVADRPQDRKHFAISVAFD
jgi:hypothetical protein